MNLYMLSPDSFFGGGIMTGRKSLQPSTHEISFGSLRAISADPLAVCRRLHPLVGVKGQTSRIN